MILERGALLNNRYRIVEILGQGGMGSVYRAIDENLGVEVAVKDNLFTTEEYARQFRREAVILANLRQPNLPRVTDHFVIEGQGQYLVMDYIEGEDLRQRIDRVGVLPEEDAIIIGAAICDALAYLSTRNPPVVHRDIKPGNVKITPQGEIFLVDFGLAKVLMGSQVTTTGARAMTPGYSPPEQYGTARTDVRSDIFSLGATLYAALTGAIPEDALSRAMDQIDLTSVRKHNPRISRRLASVIEKALEVRPDDRYQDPDDFKRALLNASANTRRRVGIYPTGGYTVEPPPSSIDSPAMSYDYSPPSGAANGLPGAAEPSPLPLPVSSPIREAQRRKSRPRRRRSWRGCWLALVAVLLLVVAGGLIAYTYDPNLPSQALGRAQALIFPPPVSIPTGTPTGTPTLEPTETNTTAAFDATQTAAALESAESSPTPTTEPTETPEPTETTVPQPTPAGGGGQIAFATSVNHVSQVYIVNVDGTGLRRVTELSEGACQPAWSPDGKRLVVISPCSGNQDSYPGAGLLLINPDGSDMTPIPTMPGGDFDPAWSPDGTRIAFTTLRDGNRPRIYEYNLLDNTVRPLSNPGDPYTWDMQPAYAPDGEKIAFITTRRGPHQVWIMDADGGNQELFSHSRDFANLHPTWSPDGKLIMYSQSNELGGVPRLVVAPYQEGGLREIVIAKGTGMIPMREGKYSPDGLWISFESWPQGGNHDIYIMTASGAGRKELTTEARFDFDPAWKPVP